MSAPLTPTQDRINYNVQSPTSVAMNPWDEDIIISKSDLEAIKRKLMKMMDDVAELMNLIMQIDGSENYP